MAVVFDKPKFLTDTPLHYCPGCTHGIAHRLVAEALEEIGAEKVVGVAPVGCSVFAYNYFNCDMQQASHGRAPAVAQGIKHVTPDSIVFAYQGDGDLASIGMAEIVHACARGANITIIFINNGIYGMTGGQMAPTTLLGQKATTCQKGRDPKVNGYPIRVCEMLKELDGPSFIARGSLADVRNIKKSKEYLVKAFKNQKEGKGLSFVELLSTCPTNWHLSPLKALDYVKNEMTSYYPLGVFKDVEE